MKTQYDDQIESLRQEGNKILKKLELLQKLREIEVNNGAEYVSHDGRASLGELVTRIMAEASQPLNFDRIVDAVQQSGYTSKAKDFPNMVYQSLLRLTHSGKVKKNENREYELIK